MQITPVSITFVLMALFSLGGALFLVLSLFGIAGMFVLLEAPFLAAVQVLVYIGAISVLITITIMVTRKVMGDEALNRQWLLAAAISLLVLIVLGFVLLNQFGGQTPVAAVPPDNLAMLGAGLADHQAYLVPFEVASVLLLAAMIGSIYVARD